MEYVFATHNLHKLREINQLVGNDFKLQSLDDFNIDEDIPETSDTLQGNALLKAKYVFARVHKPVFADDTGLEVEELDGRPGVFSARYAGLHKNPADNVARLLEELEGKENRNARFRTVISLIDEDGTHFFEGIVRGRITEFPRGDGGFGYDPVFVPEEGELTFAEMSPEAKNEISHRARAFIKMRDYLVSKLQAH